MTGARRRLPTSTEVMIARWQTSAWRDELAQAPAAVRSYVDALEDAVHQLGADQPIGWQRVGWRARLVYVELELRNALSALEDGDLAPTASHANAAHEMVEAMIDGDSRKYAATVDRLRDDPEDAAGFPDPPTPDEL